MNLLTAQELDARADPRRHVRRPTAGVVRLAGDVSCHRDRITALTLARSVEGAQSVLDELGIRRAN